MENAKKFLENLSKGELDIVQGYSGLVDSINVDALSVEKFMKDLREKGAYGFLNDLNKKKIDDLVKEFKDKLIKKLGNSEQSAKIIDKEVKAFKKQLLEKLEASLDKSKNKKIDTQILTKILLNMKSGETSNPKDFLMKL